MKNIAFALIATLMIAASAQAASKAPEVCQFKFRGYVSNLISISDDDGAGFFQAANNIAVQNRTCVYAKVASKPQTGRVYTASGALSADDSGQKKNLSVREAAEAKRNAGGRCEEVVCISIIDTNAPKYEQPIQPSTTIVIPSQPNVNVNTDGTGW